MGENKFSKGCVNQCQEWDSKLMTTRENDVKGGFQFYATHFLWSTQPQNSYFGLYKHLFCFMHISLTIGMAEESEETP